MDICEGAAHRSFRGGVNGAEHFITVAAPAGSSLAEQLDELRRRYGEALHMLRLGPESAVFRRYFVSDAMNQAARVRASDRVGAGDAGPVAVSIIEQPPLPEAKVALLAYHIESAAPLAKRRLSPRHVLVDKGALRHLWSTQICAGADGSGASPSTQTRRVFDDLIGALASQGGTLRDNCVRTWVYVKDIDVFYQGMVESRGALFAEQGLTRDTHYIASTGIEGACAHRYDLVAMDAYSIVGLVPGQVSYLNDFGRLCATKDYNVTFERGTRLGYSDRNHYFLSGTASIDNAGRVVYPGDVLRQLERALDNVEALLRSGAATLADMMHLVVYLRDPTDFALVDRYLGERLPDLPTLVVRGAVCRPEWLIEVEGMAIARADAPALPAF